MQRINAFGPARGETVLVVDDEVAVREVISEMLTCLGYHVLTASDGVEALATWREHREQIDLVLTDVSIPRMDGFGLLEAMKRVNPSVRLVFMSGYSSEASNWTTTHSWLAKPFSLQSVSLTVRQALDA